MAKWTSLCELSELSEEKGHYVEIDGFQLAVFLHAGEVYVIDDTCPHAGGSMAEGWVENGCATCPWHNWSFHVTDGTLRGNPHVKISTYPTRVFKRDGKADLVQAELPLP